MDGWPSDGVVARMRAPDDLDTRPRWRAALTIRLREGATQTFVTPAGELDLDGAPELERRLWDVQMRSRHVVVDLRALSFVDCAGLRSLVGGQLRASCWGTRLDVVCAGGQVSRLLALTGLGGLLGVIELTAPAQCADC